MLRGQKMRIRGKYLFVVVILVTLLFMAVSNFNGQPVDLASNNIQNPDTPLNLDEIKYNSTEFGIDVSSLKFDTQIVDFRTGTFLVGGNIYRLAVLFINSTLVFIDEYDNRTTVDLTARVISPKAIYKINVDGDVYSEFLILDDYHNVTLLDHDGSYLNSLNITQAKLYPFETSIEAVKIGDLVDPIGHQDFAVLTYTTLIGYGLHLVNASNGNLTIYASINLAIIDGQHFSIGNITGDAYEDIVALSGDIRIYYGNNGSFCRKSSISTYERFVATGTFTGDSVDDIVAYNTTTEELMILNGTNLNDTVNTFDFMSTFSTGLFNPPLIYDFNEDGIDDVIAGIYLPTGISIVFIAGNNMSVIRTVEPSGSGLIAIDVGSISYDYTEDHSDFVILTNEMVHYYDYYYQLTFLRYPVSFTTNALLRIGTFDDVMHQTVFIAEDQAILLLKSDNKNPVVEEISINPAHPTILDGTVSVSFIAIDLNNLRTVYVEYTSDSWKTKHRVSAIPKAREESRYTAFITNLQAADYIVKIVANDTFGNSKVVYRTFTVISEVKEKLHVGNLSYPIADMIIADINNDNISDVLVLLFNNTVFVLNGENLTTISKFTLPSSASSGGLLKFHKVGEFNPTNPGLEICILNDLTTEKQVLIYSTTGTQFQNITFSPDTDGVSIETRDFDKDGVLDLLIGNGSKLVLISAKNGSILRTIDLKPFSIYSTYSADYNNDGSYEIYALTWNGTSGRVRGFLLDLSFNVLRNNTLFDGVSSLVTDSFLFYTTNYTNIVPGYFVTNQRLHLIISNGSYSDQYYLIDPLTNSFVASYNFQKYYPSASFYTDYGQLRTVMDYDNDGLDDLIVFSEDIGKIVILRGQNLSEIEVFNTTIFFTYKSFLLDYNGDNETELAVLTYDEIFLIDIYTGNIIDILGYPSEFGLRARINRDNADDIVVASSEWVYLLQNLDIRYLLEFNNFAVSGDYKNGTYSVFQGNSLMISFRLLNYYDEFVRGADAFVLYSVFGHLRKMSFTTTETFYYLTIPTSELPLGTYNFTILVDHDYYTPTMKNVTIKIVGTLKTLGIPDVFTNSSGEYLNYTFEVIDESFFPVYNASINVTLYTPTSNINMELVHIGDNVYSVLYNLTSSQKGVYYIAVELDHPYAIFPTYNYEEFSIYRNITVSVNGTGIYGTTMVGQGNSSTLTVTVKDIYGNPVPDADVTMQIGSQYIAFTYDYMNEVYIGTFTAVNMPAGENVYFVFVSGDYIAAETTNGTIRVRGVPVYEVFVSPENPEQFSTIRVAARIHDLYGYPIENQTVFVIFNGKSYEMQEDLALRGTYFVEIDIGYVYHGDYEIQVRIQSEWYVEKAKTKTITVIVKPPDLQLSLNDFLTLTAISFVLSFVGLIIYFAVSRRFRTIESVADVSRIKKSLKILNYLYLVILLGFLGSVGGAFVLARAGNYAMSVAIAGLILMEILLLYGIWMFRDTLEIIVTEKFNLIRFLLGLWHLLAVPVVILGIVEWGKNIEWFAVYILEDVYNLGFAVIPSIYLSLLGTYITSFVIIVINIYREAIRNRNRINQMREGGTPENVLLDEKEIIMERLSNSIRLKSFIFLVILGTSIVTTTNLLRYYQLGVVVLIPLVLIVIIPYITARILKIFKVFRRENRATIPT